MGGNAFKRPGRLNEPILFTPRLSNSTFLAMRELIIPKLLNHFCLTGTYPPHPEKSEHGDMDVLICGPKNNLKAKYTIRELHTDLNSILGAKRSRVNDITGYFGVPIPANLVPDHLDSSLEEVYIQIDITLVDAPSQFDYSVMRHAHGSLMNILQFGLRPAGFIFSPNGLSVKVPESFDLTLTRADRPDLLFLSNDPEKIVEFFGLPKRCWIEEFASSDDYWKCVTSAKFFSRDLFFAETTADHFGEDNDDVNVDLMKGSASSNTSVSGEDDNDTIFSADYSRDHLSTRCHKGYDNLNAYYARRPGWLQFTDTWLPSHPHIGATPPNRTKAFHEAVEFFDKKDQYVRQRCEWREKRSEAAFWEEVRERVLPGLKGKQRHARANQAVVALKRYVMFEQRRGRGQVPVILQHGEGGVVPKNPTQETPWTSQLAEFTGGFTRDELLGWIVDNAEEIRELSRWPVRAKRVEKETARLERRREAMKRATWSGSAICGMVWCVRVVLAGMLSVVDGAEKWWFGEVGLQLRNYSVSLAEEKAAVEAGDIVTVPRA
jgi:hypothetical protein